VSAGETEPRDHDPVAHADLVTGAGSERLDDPDALVARDQWQRRLDRQSPCAAWMSVWQTPQALIRTSTWPSLGSGMGTFSMLSGWVKS
jgi:hypothetical protein